MKKIWALLIACCFAAFMVGCEPADKPAQDTGSGDSAASDTADDTDADTDDSSDEDVADDTDATE